MYSISQIYGDVEKTREDRKAFAKSRFVKVQPYIIIVGNKEKHDVDSIYLIINDNEYAMNSLLNAIDICFKAYHVFNALYTSQSEHIWQTIQIGVYKFRTKWDKDFPKVKEILFDSKLYLE